MPYLTSRCRQVVPPKIVEMPLSAPRPTDSRVGEEEPDSSIPNGAPHIILACNRERDINIYICMYVYIYIYMYVYVNT